MLTHPVRKENRKLKQHLSPVLNPARPFTCYIHGGQVKHLEQGFVTREDTLALREFSQLPAIAHDDVRRINELADPRWVLEERCQLVPILALGGTISECLAPQISSNRSSSTSAASSDAAL